MAVFNDPGLTPSSSISSIPTIAIAYCIAVVVDWIILCLEHFSKKREGRAQGGNNASLSEQLQGQVPVLKRDVVGSSSSAPSGHAAEKTDSSDKVSDLGAGLGRPVSKQRFSGNLGD